jgi:phage regulator Rha-like protein
MNITNYMSSSANLLPPADTLTMSSREIAERTGKEHSNVLRDIRQMLIGLYGDDHLERIVPEQYRNRHSEYVRENASAILDAIFPSNEGHSNWNDPGRGFKWERDKRGYVIAFHLDKEHTVTLVAGYDVKLRKRIIDRWIELEESVRTQVPMHYVISEQVRAEVERQIQHALSNQTHKLVIEYVSVGEILNMEKVPPKGRRGLVTASASRLRKFCERNGIIPRLMRTGCSERYVYNPDIVARWLAEEGRNLIRQYRDKRAGQGVLSFPRAVKKPSTDGGAS